MNFDVDAAKNALEVARNGAATMDAIISSVNRLKLIFQSPKPLPMDDVRAAVTDLGEKVMKAREENILLREQAIELRDQIIEMKRREEKFAGYELWESPLGSILLRSGEGVKPIHYLCPGCHDAGVKTILQGDRYSKKCAATPGHGWFHFEQSPPQPGRRMLSHGINR